MSDTKKYDNENQMQDGNGQYNQQSQSSSQHVNHQSIDISESYDDDEVVMPAAGEHDNSAKKRPKRPKKNKSLLGPTGAFPSEKKEVSATKVRARRKLEAQQRITHQIIKYGALFLLVGQMVGLVLLMRYSRTVPRAPDTPLYLASTAVFVMEIIKLVICLGVVALQTNSTFMNEIRIHIFQSPNELLKLCIPSLLYTIQNNLLYLALTNLDAATYQVCYQLKILTTAIFSVIMLQRKFSVVKWISLIVLTIGVAIVEVSGSGDQHMSNKTGTADDASKNRFIGIVAVICAACTSGFSGVFFEKILKGSTTSLWIRNIQMGIPSVIIAYLTCYIKDSAEISKYGFLGGYSSIVWVVVIVQAVGGLIVATVVKYADNVLKVFATSFSIIISCIISAFLFDFHPSLLFMIGTSFVVAATVMYSAPEGSSSRRSSASSSNTGGKPLLPMTNKPRK